MSDIWKEVQETWMVYIYYSGGDADWVAQDTDDIFLLFYDLSFQYIQE